MLGLQSILRISVPSWVAAMLLAALPAHAQEMRAPQASAAVQKYCATCHSSQIHTADLVLDPAAVAHPQTEAERWEKVIRKLRARSMPPPGAPRPDPATYNALQKFVEAGIDSAAAAHPHPGKLPLLHRLSRTEYQNAVRDLLSLDALPKEMEFGMLLPADNANSGFDNLADLLFISPTAMESYLGAAEKISRLSIGDPAFPVMVNTYRMPDEEIQSVRMDGLPPGTRGGLAVHSDFPLDGEYAIKVMLTGTSSEPQQLEITVDGERMQLASIAAGQGGGKKGASAGPARNVRMSAVAAAAADPGASTYGQAAPPRKPLEFRIPVKAGSRTIGIAFIERNELRDEEVLRPRWRSTGSELAVETASISGPFHPGGPGDTAVAAAHLRVPAGFRCR